MKTIVLLGFAIVAAALADNALRAHPPYLCYLARTNDGRAALCPPDERELSFAAIKAAYAPSEGRVLDRHGRLLHELRVDMTRRRAGWVALGAVSPSLIGTLVRIEDHRFYRHRGVDWRALLGVAWNLMHGVPPRGASTLSMQLVGLLDREHRLLQITAKHPLLRKWAQMRAARALEAAWSKNQILEAYLNLASFRGEVSGIGAASASLFGKSPDSLDATQSLLLTTLLRSPNAAANSIGARGCRLIEALALRTNCAAFARLAHARLRASPKLQPQMALAPQLARRVLGHELREVTTSVDRALQQIVVNALQRQLNTLRERHVRDGAALVMANATGEVLAYVGNTGATASARYVDGVVALRQAGSTFKPFLYGLALEQKLLTAASLLDDSPVNLQTPTGLYVPENYDHEFKGLVSLRTSLAASLNIPAVRTLMLIGPDRFIARLQNLGFSAVTEDADYYGYALALGSAEASLWQLVNAYRVLANTGAAACSATFARADSANDCVRTTPTLDPAASYIISDILSDRGSRSLTFGLDGPLTTPFWSAVKTGTSKHMRDNWCIGYSERYTVGVWVGNFDGSPMHDVSGMTGAAPVWAEIMRSLHQHAPSHPPRARGVVRAEVRFVRGVEAPRPEWFIKGTAISEIRPAREAALTPRIVYPGADSIVVIDPDIPLSAQRVFFEMRPARKDLQWILNGKRVGVGANLAWAPTPGAHTLGLLGRDLREIDQVRFQVRGGTP